MNDSAAPLKTIMLHKTKIKTKIKDKDKDKDKRFHMNNWNKVKTSNERRFHMQNGYLENCFCYFLINSSWNPFKHGYLKPDPDIEHNGCWTWRIFIVLPELRWCGKALVVWWRFLANHFVFKMEKI